MVTASKAMADFFEATVAVYKDAKVVSNWMMGEIAKHLNAEGLEINETKLTPIQLVELLKLQDDNIISGKIAKTVFEEMFATGKMPSKIVKEKGLVQITDESAIAAVIDQVIAGNPKSAEDFRSGKEAEIGFLVGQVMKLTKGKANPALANKLLREKLSP